MADNTTLPGTGDVIADKEIEGVKHQSMLIADGTLGQAVVATVKPVDVGYYDAAIAVRPIPTDAPTAPSSEQFAETEYLGLGDSGEDRTLYELLDPLGANSQPLRTAPADISQPGRQAEQMSLPVALATEQTLDGFLSAAWGPGVWNLNRNALDPSGLWTDVSRYRSIAVQTRTETGVTVTLLFEGSNDGLNPVALPMFDAAAMTTAPVTTIAQAVATSRFWVGPIPFKYVRFRISVAVAGGSFSCYTRLSMAPYATSTTQVAGAAATTKVDVGLLGATAPVTAGLAGTLAVGGNIAAGVTPTTNPLLIGGVDTALLIRRLLVDAVGQQQVTGPDSRNFQSTMNAVSIFNPKFDTYLAGILRELRALNLAVACMANGVPVPETLSDDLTNWSDSDTVSQ